MLVKSSILQRNRRIFNVLRNFIRRNNAPLYASVQVVKEHFAGAVVYFGGFTHSTLAKRRKVGDAEGRNPKRNNPRCDKSERHKKHKHTPYKAFLFTAHKKHTNTGLLW